MAGALVTTDLLRDDGDLVAERDALRARIAGMARRTELCRELEARQRLVTRILLERGLARQRAAAASDDTGLRYFQK